MRQALLLIIGVWVVLSCQEIKDCELESSTDYLIVKYYLADTSAKIPVIPSFDKIWTPSSTFYFGKDSTNNFSILYLHSESNSINYFFEKETSTYELSLDYEPHLRIYYDECEPVYSYKIKNAYGAAFDSVALINNVLNIGVPVNLEIYIK